MDILLVTATAMEMRAVLSGLPRSGTAGKGAEDAANSRQTNDAPLPLTLQFGRYCLHPLVCGIGPVNAGFALGSCLGLTGPSGKQPAFAAVINMGIAGTYDPALLPLGSVALASAEIWPEYGLADGGRVDAGGIGFAQTVYRGKRIVERVELAPQDVLDSLGIGWRTPPQICPAVTVAGCSASPAQAKRMQERTQGLMENMEGFALALGCLLYENGLGSPGVDGSSGVAPVKPGEAEQAFEAQGDACLQALPALPFVEIRSISNVAGHRPPENWDMPGALAALARAAKELFS